MTGEFAAVRSEMKQEFTVVQKDLAVILDQTPHVTERLTTLEKLDNIPRR